jgi:hypothetical protein
VRASVRCAPASVSATGADFRPLNVTACRSPEVESKRLFFGNNGDGPFSIVNFSLGVVPYQILDAGPMFTLTETAD